jgi:hypothetical protein
VYELKSQSDFNKYIGKRASLESGAVARVLEVLNSAPDADEYTQYLKALSLADMDIYTRPDNEFDFYEATEITDPSDERYGKSGYLYTTIEYTEKVKQQIEVDGVLVDEVDADGNFIYVAGPITSTVTIALTKVENISSIQ